VQRLYREFGQRLRKARDDADLTQQDVADRVGLKRTSITNIEAGRQHISLHQLFLLADAVGSNPLELLPKGDGALEDLLEPKVLQELQPNPNERGFAEKVLQKRANATETGRSEE
jgi:transcriptional regulator with XRE-family HTH domain